MDDETIIVITILGGVAVMIAVMLSLRGKAEARLAAQETIEIPLDSTAKSVAIVLLAMMGAPFLVLALGLAVGIQGHALAVTLGMISAGFIALPVALRLTREFRRVGVLRMTPARLELEHPRGSSSVELDREFVIRESWSLGPYGNSIQTFSVEQGSGRVDVSYLLPAGRKAYGESGGGHYDPQLSGEVRVLHDRLRELKTATTSGLARNLPR